jgi:hypothetical protein
LSQFYDFEHASIHEMQHTSVLAGRLPCQISRPSSFRLRRKISHSDCRLELACSVCQNPRCSLTAPSTYISPWRVPSVTVEGSSAPSSVLGSVVVKPSDNVLSRVLVWPHSLQVRPSSADRGSQYRHWCKNFQNSKDKTSILSLDPPTEEAAWTSRRPQLPFRTVPLLSLLHSQRKLFGPQHLDPPPLLKDAHARTSLELFSICCETALADAVFLTRAAGLLVVTRAVE